MSLPDSHGDSGLIENLFPDPGKIFADQDFVKPPTSVDTGQKRWPRLRRVGVLSVDVFKRLFAHAKRVDIVLGEAEFLVSIASNLSVLPELDIFNVRISDNDFELEIERPWELLDVPVSWWEKIPGDLRAGLLTDALNGVIGHTRPLRVTHIGVSSRSNSNVSEKLCEIPFVLESVLSSLAYRGRLRFNALSAPLVLAAWGSRTARGVPRVPEILMPFSVELLSAKISAKELDRLRQGALVPLGVPLVGKDVLVSVGWCKRYVAPATFNENNVTLQGGLKPMEESRANNVGVPLSDLSKLENLEVQFTVELATCSLPLSELSRLGPGSTLNLGLPHEPPLVRLCVNGKAVATGELVILGQSLGVQVVDLASA